MAFPKQDSVSRRLHKETLNALELTGAKGLMSLKHQWFDHRKEMQLAIMNAYRAAAPKGTWDLRSFRAFAEPMLQSELRAVLARFHAVTTQTIKDNLNALYGQSCMRYAWILDQITPESRNIMVPHRQKIHESAVAGIFYGAEASKAWTDKWGQWVDSYGSALMNNLAIGASNASLVSDAVNEVDATKSNTPQSSLFDALTRLFDYAATAAMVEGESSIATLNDDMVDEEVWRTREDLRVCDDCDANDGVPLEDADGTIPLHPECHCWSELVPKSYGALLRSGDSDDQDLARQMSVDGVAPNALVIRNPQGQIAAKSIVSFQSWTRANERQGVGSF